MTIGAYLPKSNVFANYGADIKANLLAASLTFTCVALSFN